MRRYIFIIMCILASLPMLAQNRTVKGTVVDSQGEPIIGATVRVDGAEKRATVTDLDGQFTIEAAPKEKLRISFVGYEDAVVTANSNVKVTLKEDSQLMDEVVVVGYGTQKKATLTGAVSAISNKEMTVTKNENVVNMLSGKIPGVRITQLSAQPGAADNKIDIRGMGTPLIIVDGIPRDQSYFSRMDANEIDNISVLKDASASIYGVRAANGVILVTTKHGSANADSKFDVTFSANYGWQNFLYVPETASSVDHMLLMNEKYKYGFNNNYPAVHNDSYYSWNQILEADHDRNMGTNWSDVLFNNNVPQQQYNVSVNGSSQKIDYFFNLGYLDQMGSYSTESLNYKRWNFRSNVDARITDRFRASVQLSGYMDERNEPFTDIWTVYKRAWTYKPTASPWVYAPMLDENGNIMKDQNTGKTIYDTSTPYMNMDKTEFLENENPLAAIDADMTGFRRYKNVNFNGALTLQYDFKYVKGLQAKAFYSYDYSASNDTEQKKLFYLYADQGGKTLTRLEQNSPATLRRSTYPYYSTMMQLSLNYNRQFGDHNVGALLLFEESYNNSDNFFAQRTMQLASDYLFAGEDEDKDGNSNMDGIWDETRRAWVGRVNYDYQGKYMAEFAFREDGSSKWSKGHRWGFFPSVLVGWRISEEPWMKKAVPFLSNLKVRASYGEMGDDAVAGHYPPTVIGYQLDALRYNWIFGSTTMSGVSPTAIPNPDLTWYKAKTKNIGLDFELWNGLLGGTFELFQRNRTGLLERSSVVLPDLVGAEMPLENIESDKTFGWEISLTHRNRVADVNYYVTGQISATKNRWDYKLNGQGENSMKDWYNLNFSGRNKDIWMSVEEGGRFSSIEEIQHHTTTGKNYGQGTLPGDYWYEDWNGDGVVNDDDKHPIANYNLPVFNYGFTMGADWRGIDLSMAWQGAAGVYGEYGEVFTEVGPFNGGAALDIYTDRWHTKNVNDDPWNPNTEWISGYYPATGHSFNEYQTGILNTSYLRLKSIELGYTLPKKWMQFAGIKSVRVYVNAYNLLTISGLKNMDPERPGASGSTFTGSGNNTDTNSSLFYRYPVNRTFNIGGTIKF